MSIETLNLVLSIGASLATILSLLWNRSNSKKIKNLANNIKSGDNSVNNSGNKNSINYAK